MIVEEKYLWEEFCCSSVILMMKYFFVHIFISLDSLKNKYMFFARRTILI